MCCVITVFDVGMINARIDSHQKILYAKHMVERINTFENVLERGADYIHETHNLILRANVMLKDIVQKPVSPENTMT